MSWVRIHPFITNWPGGGDPPVFEINSDENGTAVIEIAWDPQALAAPATYPDPLRYFATSSGFSGTVRKADGGTLALSVPAQTITLAANRAVWAIPADLWAGYREESLKTLGGPTVTTFSSNLYYRVRVTAPGAAQATIWPPDAVLQAPNAASAPHIGVLRMSASVASQVPPDTAAINAMGGLPWAPSLWGGVLTSLYRSAPDTDPLKQSLMAVFAHPVYQGLAVPARADVLRLWLFAGLGRLKVPRLLSRRAVTGSGIASPIVTKTAYVGGKDLVATLLDLVSIVPHPDLGVFTREQLVDDVLTEILDPNGQVNQGGAGTCVPTSIQAMLIAINPAEYARLQCGWLSSAGKASLADGSVADVPVGVLQIARYSTPHGTFSPSNVGFLARTFSEMAFQGAMMKRGTPGFPAGDGTEATTQAIFEKVYAGGLDQDGTKRVVDALYAANFVKSQMAWPAAVPSPVPPGSSLQSLDPTLAAKQAAITTALIAQLQALPTPVLLATYWNTPVTAVIPPGKQAYQAYATHCVVAMRQDGGRVFFKNPQYAGTSPAGIPGGTAANPPRRYEDPSATLESMTTSDLNSWIYWYLAPDKALI